MALSGKCLCESITFEISGQARDVVNCHCTRCRRHTGHFMAATQAATDDVDIHGETFRWFNPTYEVQYGSCGSCGSTLFWRTARHPDRISIAAGTLTPPTGLKTVAAIFTDYASDYHSFDESTPRYPEDRRSSSDWPRLNR